MPHRSYRNSPCPPRVSRLDTLVWSIAVCIGTALPAQVADSGRADALQHRFADYQARAKAFTEAAAAMSAREGKATPADWKPVLSLRVPMESLQQELWDDYLAGPRDALGLETCLFLAGNTHLDKALVRQEVLAHYANEDAVCSLVRFRAAPQQFAKADEAFLRALIAASSSPSVQAAARSTLAQCLHDMGTFLGDLKEFDTSVEDALFDLMGRAAQMFRDTVGSGANGDATPSRDELRAALKSRLPSMSLYAWKDSDPAALAGEATALLEELLKAPAETPVYRADFASGRLQTVADSTNGKLAAALAKTIHDGLTKRPAPELLAVDYDSKAADLAQLRGKVVLLDFWATWCAPCKAAMPGNDEIANKLAGRPFELVTLSVDRDVELARRFMGEHGYHFTNWHLGPDHPALARWRVSSYPTCIVIDDLGIVRSIPRVDHAALERYLQKLVVAAESRPTASDAASPAGKRQ